MDDSVQYTSYTQKHSDIIQKDIDSIREFLLTESKQEKQSLLFCMDKFLDPWFGYNLLHLDDIIILLQQHLFIPEDHEIKEEILDLLTRYSTHSLDYLAEHLSHIDSSLLADAVYALGLSYNKAYLPIVKFYESHPDPAVQQAAREGVHELNLAKE